MTAVLRRTAAFLLAAVLLFALCACDLGDLTRPPESEGGTETERQTEKPTETAAETEKQTDPETAAATEKDTREVPPSAFGDAFYEQLTPNEKAIYATVSGSLPGDELTAVLAEPVFLRADGQGGVLEEDRNAFGAAMNLALKTALVALWLDDPTFFWAEIGVQGNTYRFLTESASGGVSVTAIVFRVLIKEEYSTTAITALNLLQTGVQEAAVTGGDRYELVAALIDYIGARTVYDSNGVSPYAHDALGVLGGEGIAGYAVCEGYSRAFQLLCQKYDIPCISVIGKGITASSEESHMWNLVRMEDGKWYAVDATWCDSSGTYDYRLVGSESVAFDGFSFGNSHILKPKIGDEARTFEYPNIEYSAYTPD